MLRHAYATHTHFGTLVKFKVPYSNDHMIPYYATKHN
jgi:hypothetical protein